MIPLTKEQINAMTTVEERQRAIWHTEQMIAYAHSMIQIWCAKANLEKNEQHLEIANQHANNIQIWIDNCLKLKQSIVELIAKEEYHKESYRRELSRGEKLSTLRREGF